jgi:ABC-type transporter MlaC component
MFLKLRIDFPTPVRIAALLLLTLAPPLMAEEKSPVSGFKSDLHSALAVRYDPALQAPETNDQQKQQIWALIDAAFDEDFIIPNILQRTWPALTTDEKTKLRPAASWAIKWKFIGKLYKYNVREITFKKESLNSDQYLLDAVLGTGRLRHPATFVFLKKEGRWVAVDIRVRGASLSGHYRRKFDGTYFKQGLTGLLKHLEREVNEEFEEMGFRPEIFSSK